MSHIALIRSASSAVSKSQYNIQEIGLAKELVKCDKGLLVDVFLISDKDKTYHEQLGDENRVTVYWMKGFKIPGQQGYYPELKKILDDAQYDLIQALDDSQITTVLVSEYCRRNKIPFILWQGMYENYPEKYKWAIQYVFDWTLLRILRKNTKYCLAKTTSAKKYLQKKYFSNIRVIPVALETSNFKEDCDMNYREKLGIDKEKKILLYVGKVEERRKPIFCLDTYKKVKEKEDACCLVYVGQGPMLEEAHQYVKEQQIKDVCFIDKIPQSELSGLYRESSLFILPTRYEIFGMVLMEAMYFGTPVITYKAAGPVDIIDNGKDGIVMNSFDSDAWADEIYKHIFIKNDTSDMGIRGKKKIESEYIWPVIAKKYYHSYMQVLSGKENRGIAE